MDYYYDNYVLNLSKRFSRRLEDISADHNFDLGEEFEIAICQILRNFLPIKYGICRGFVVDIAGNKAGDDIIVYDQVVFPTLKNIDKNDFSRKENIPIEAVYAYIEAKHTLDRSNFSKSFNQIIAVKDLCAKRDKMNLYEPDPYIGKYQDKGNVVRSLPKYRNPVLGIVISRFAVDRKGKKTRDPEMIKEFLHEQFTSIKSNPNSPELVIAGNSNFLSISYIEEDGETKPTMFYPDNGAEIIGYQNHIRTEMIYGIFLSHLMAAMNWIRLGRMPWEEIINQAKLE